MKRKDKCKTNNRKRSAALDYCLSNLPFFNKYN